MNIIPWIIFGALVGWFASLLSRRNGRMGALANIVIGVIGALIGGFLMNAFGGQGVIGFNLTSLVVAILASVVLLFLAGLFVGHGSTRSGTKPPQEVRPSTVPKVQKKSEEASRAAAETQQQPEPPKKTESTTPPVHSEAKSSATNIFVSYRRSDSADAAGRIYDRLVGSFGKASIFKDVDSIPLGYDFKEYLAEKVSNCNVLLAIIGDRWLDASDGAGRRRLEDPGDFVRIEIESALARDILVIPLLVRGASMPAEAELPGSLKKLVFRNGTQIRSDPDFHRDMDRLIAAIQRHIERSAKL